MSPIRIGLPGVTPSAVTIESIVNLYGNKIFQLAFHLTGSTSDAEDVTQEVFLKLFRSWTQVTAFSNFQAWIRRVVTNAALDLLRSRQSRQKRERGAPGGDPDEVAERRPQEPAARLDQQELQEQLSRAMEDLSPQQHAALILFDHEGLKAREIADIMNVSEATVRGYVCEARRRMKDRLAPYLAGNDR